MLQKKLVSLFAAGFAACLLGSAAQAAAPLQKTQAPGFFRMALGDFEVTALNDGYLPIDPALLKDLPAAELAKLNARSMITQKTLLASVNAYLVNTGGQLILVDAGSAACFGPTAGKLQDSLKAAGYTPEQVDLIVITHMHGDHLCGVNSTEGKPLFPNAVLRVAKADADYWLGEPGPKVPENMKGMFTMARDAVKPYLAAGKFKPFAPGEQLAEGMKVVDTNGHTPGHSSYQFSSQGQNLLVIGDLIHVHSVQLPRPLTGIVFDTDGAKAVPMRKHVFDAAAASKTWIGAAHLPFPGLGQLRVEGKSYDWVPVDFAPYGVSH